jgi:hypothetical protein
MTCCSPHDLSRFAAASRQAPRSALGAPKPRQRDPSCGERNERLAARYFCRDAESARRLAQASTIKFPWYRLVQRQCALVLLRHKLRRERAVFAAAQEGQR